MMHDIFSFNIIVIIWFEFENSIVSKVSDRNFLSIGPHNTKMKVVRVSRSSIGLFSQCGAQRMHKLQIRDTRGLFSLL